MSEVVKLTRRELLVIGITGSGLALGIGAVGQSKTSAAFFPSPMLRIDPTGGITLWANKLEMGQGIHTSLAMILADELGADWARVRIVQAPFGPQYGNQETRGSHSIRAMHQPLRELGAKARGMLMRAAEAKWKVPFEQLTVRNGAVLHSPSARRLSFGELAGAAARLSIPREPAITKRPAATLVGKPVKRKDTPSKTDGSARFPMDVRLPGMLFACIARSPVFGSKLLTVDESKARKANGVKNVVRISSGVAVIADSTWAAIQGREALVLTWETSPNDAESSIKLRGRMDDASKLPGNALNKDGTSAPPAGTPIESVYETPFQGHQAMEPLSATARLSAGLCEVWAGTQDPAWAHAEIKRVTGLADSAIRFNIVPMGGTFGRAINPDFIVEAVEVAKAAGAPVKVFRTREDDTQFDNFRPASLHRMTGSLDSAGKPASWSHHIVSTPIVEKSSERYVERFETAGANGIPYSVPNASRSYTPVESHVPRGCWRSVPHASNAFAIESFIDELAVAAKVDPLQFRIQSLGGSRKIETHDGALVTSRLQRVLILAAERSVWGRALPPRQGRGIAGHFSFGSYVGAVAEVVVDKDGNVKVSRFTIAIDCGTVVNPDSVVAQMEGSVAFGLTSALMSRITIENGKTLESNFHNAPVLRISDMPRVDVLIVPSSEKPGGAGEPAVPVIAPALCNALFAATGVRIRALPVRTRLLRQR